MIPSDAPAAVFTIADLTPEQIEIRSTIRAFMDDEVQAKSDTIESKDLALTRELFRKLGELGFLGIEVPDAFGGMDMDKVTAALVGEEVGKQGSFACTFLDHTGIGTAPIMYFGTREQKERYLPGLVSGALMGAYALTEAGSGSDANAARTTAVLSPDGSVYTLRGEKMFVTSAAFADVFTVFAQISGVGLTAFIVERGYPGVSFGKEEVKMGIKGSSTATMVLDDVPVPVTNLLGQAGQGLKIALNVLNFGRFKLGAASLGAARMCLEVAATYALERKQFKKSIRSFGLIRQKLARMAADIFAMESVVYRTAALLDDATKSVDANDSAAVLKAIGDCAVECSAVKVFCSEALYRIADETVQVHGGYGYVASYPAERFLRDARINRIFEGTNEINRLLSFAMLMRKAMKGEVPLLQEGAKIKDELMGMSAAQEPDDIAGRLLFRLNGSKKAALMVSDAVVKSLGPALMGDAADDHQEVIGMLADVLIPVYVLDSVLGAYAKAPSSQNEAKTRLLFAQLIPEVELNARNALACVLEGDDLRMHLGFIRKLLKYTPENTLALDRAIDSNL